MTAVFVGIVALTFVGACWVDHLIAVGRRHR